MHSRPLLLRSTSTRIARAWSGVTHPHAQVMSADAFNRGVVRSGTDYSVYIAEGRDGLDFSFYRQRSKYHTKEDAIPSLGGKAALWSMMESTLLAGLAIVDDESDGSNAKGSPVYFDRKYMLFQGGASSDHFNLSVRRSACRCIPQDFLHH